MPAGGRHSGQAACYVSSGNLARQLFQQPHPQRWIALKSPVQGFDRHQDHRSGSDRAQGVCMMPVSEHGSQFDKFPWSSRTECDAHLKPLRLAHKITGNYDIQSLTRLMLAKDRLASLEIDGPRFPAQQATRLLRALQQLRERMRRCGGETLEPRVGLIANHFLAHFRLQKSQIEVSARLPFPGGEASSERAAVTVPACLLQRPDRNLKKLFLIDTRSLWRNTQNRHARGCEQSESRAVRPLYPAHAFYPGHKNAGVTFGNRFLNSFSRVAVLHDAMYWSLVEQPA
jgi:hypothetical protein